MNYLRKLLFPNILHFNGNKIHQEEIFIKTVPIKRYACILITMIINRYSNSKEEVTKSNFL